MYGNQMEMFQEGGVMLEDEGGEVEETSGNEVPLGGTKEGVADDQPANLSVGEMVLSADVVNYHGVEKVMSWRDEAKIGYHKMEAMGQLGNADEATIPTEAIFNPGGMPFSVVDLEYIDMEDDTDVAEAASGMYVQDEMNMQTGGAVPFLRGEELQRIDPATGRPMQRPDQSVMSTNPVTGQPYVTSPPPGTSPPPSQLARIQPVSMTPIPSTTPTVVDPSKPITQQPAIPTPSALPTTGEFLGGTQSFNSYINADGNIIKIPVVNGQQTYVTPEGYQKYNPENPKPFDPSLEQKEEDVKPETTLTQEPVVLPPHLGGIGADDAFSGGSPGWSGSISGLAEGEDEVEGFAAHVNSLSKNGIISGKTGSGILAAVTTGNPLAVGWAFYGALKEATTRETAKEDAKKAAKAYKEEDEAIAARTIAESAKKEADRLSALDLDNPITSAAVTKSYEKGEEGMAPARSVTPEESTGYKSLDAMAEATGGDAGGPAGGAAAAAEAEADVAAGVTGPGGNWDEGGFVPKIKFKSNPKQRRKGLAARK